MEFHELAGKFPEMGQKEFEALRDETYFFLKDFAQSPSQSKSTKSFNSFTTQKGLTVITNTRNPPSSAEH